MRIQHNIMAMNAYRNMGKNNGALSKNLEKLSSGYRINRAGDDAAGLAISEKMRAQIAGLDQAQKNAQSGINLVQTAEGALTEVHDMLNRMVTLSTQAANGTYSKTDREKIQAEINALTEEIDRIADNSNFNGTKLLDGSLAGGVAGALKDVVADVSKMGVDVVANAGDIDAVAGVYSTSALTGGADVVLDEAKDRFNVTVKFTDGDGVEQSVSVSLFAKMDGNNELYLDDGTEGGKKLTTIGCTTTDGTIDAAEIGTAVAEALQYNDAIKANFSITDNGDDTLTFTAKTKGTAGAVLTSIEVSEFDNATKNTSPTYGVTNHANKVDVATEATDAMKSYDFSVNGKLWDSTLAADVSGGGSAPDQVTKLEDAVFELNGEKFVFVNTAPSDDDLKELEAAGVKHWVTVANAGAIDGDDVTAMVEKMKKETGLDIRQGTDDGAGVFTENVSAGDIHIIIKDSKVETEGTEGNALTLQIGADSVETIGVSVDSMKAESLGIKNLDISDADKANDAIETVKTAIEKVSVQRGNLGAVQNRLEHTINNLGVMEENIQDAEANIRDTDIADEMMAYTKNNILIQSAQAMLAQANQAPQGVLQLMG